MTDTPRPAIKNSPFWFPAVAGVVVLFGLALVLVYQQLHQQARSSAAETLESVATLKSNEIRRWLNDRLILFSQPPDSILVTQFARLQLGNKAAEHLLEARLRHLHATTPELRSIWLYDRNGKPWFGTKGTRPYDDSAHAHPVRHALEMGQAQFVDLHHTNDGNGDIALEIIAPLNRDLDSGSETIGYVLFQIDPAVEFFPLIQLWPVPSTTAESLLIRRDGDSVVFLNSLRHIPTAPLLKRIPLSTPGLVAGQAILSPEKIIEGIDYRGQPALGAAQPIPGTEWILIAKMDLREVYGEAKHVFNWIVVLGLLLLGLTLLLGRSMIARQRAEAYSNELHKRHRIEADLAENEQRLRSLGDNLPDSYVYQLTFTTEGKPQFLYLSSGVERIHGISAQAALKDASLIYRQILAEDLAGNIEAERISREQMADYAHTFRILRPDGWVRWVYARSHPSRDAAGREIWDGVLSDITRQKNDEEVLTLLTRRGFYLLELPKLADGPDEAPLLRRGLEMIEDLTTSSISCAYFVTENDDAPELSLPHAYPLDTSGQLNSEFVADMARDAAHRHTPVIINDVAAEKTTPPADGLTRLVCLPVLEADRSVMVICIGNKPDAYNERDIETLQLFANDIWRIVRKMRSETELASNLERQQELNRKLEAMQTQLLQSEKMASIGQLAAGVAHELNNPIGFVNSNLGSLEIYLRDLFEIADAYAEAEAADAANSPTFERVRQLKRDKDYGFLRSDVFQLLAESKDGLGRVTKIVKDLKSFSHAGEARMQWADLHTGLDSTLNVVWNELKYKCLVRKEYGDLPLVWCEPSQINQVFMNLLVNASHAIVDRGEITIRTGTSDQEAFVSISDTGTGIPPEHLKRIFDPFFTTKPVGKGTGLGLSLAYGIVNKHQGRIEVQSTVGVGTTFTIWLPIGPAGETAEPAQQTTENA